MRHAGQVHAGIHLHAHLSSRFSAVMLGEVEVLEVPTLSGSRVGLVCPAHAWGEVVWWKCGPRHCPRYVWCALHMPTKSACLAGARGRQLPGAPGDGIRTRVSSWQTLNPTQNGWQVRKGASYPVRLATAHPIHENCRVRHFRRLLTAPPDHDAGEQLSLLGELMFQARMRRCTAAAARLE